MPRRIRALGTDGFGRSEDRAALRDFFEVDARFVAVATLSELLKEGQIERRAGDQGSRDRPEKPNPAISSGSATPRSSTGDLQHGSLHLRLD